MSDIPAQTPAPLPPRPRLEAEFELLDWSRAYPTELQMRYNDIDAMGHLNNAVYVQYLETSRVVMMRELEAAQSGRAVVARLELDYRREIKMGQEVVVENMIEHLGNSSWTVISRILADGKPSAFSRVVEVAVDEQHRPVPLGAELRAVLEPLLVRKQP